MTKIVRPKIIRNFCASTTS